DWWWIPGAAVFVGLAALFTFLSPYLIPGQRDAPPALVAEADRLAAEQGLPAIPVRIQEVDAWEGPNAAATGLGPSRRVILWNTLVDSFAEDEVRVVLGHELAHHSRNHLWKNLGWYALFAVPGAFLIAWAAKRRGGMREPTAVPLALLMLVVLQTLALPVQNAIIRHLEAEADWVALETTEDPDGARRLWRGFSEEALLDPSPPTWSSLLFETHPTVAQRIAMTEAWREHGGR
ncbi:MAG: M48 family metalloprotease, partial [Gaiellaceae bacterium]